MRPYESFGVYPQRKSSHEFNLTHFEFLYLTTAERLNHKNSLKITGRIEKPIRRKGKEKNSE